ncbi:MAG: hypothetical protein HGA45_02765 [Chloroflexales bacterium]|nr:hypothetical protein [Chloroflexales bacterium]
MSQGFRGLLIAILLTALLAYQASRAAPRSRLRQTYSLAAGGVGLMIVINSLWLLGVTGGLLVNIVGFAAFGLLVGAVATLMLAYFNGEFQTKIRQVQAYTADERERSARKRLEHERLGSSSQDHPREPGDNEGKPGS